MSKPDELRLLFITSLLRLRVQVTVSPPSDGSYTACLEALGLTPDEYAQIVKRYMEYAGRSLSGIDIAILAELAEKHGHKFQGSPVKGYDSVKLRKVRGHYEPVFRFSRGRTKGSLRKKDPVTYEKIVDAVLGFKGNDDGVTPTRKLIAKKLRCSPPTITVVLRQHGVKVGWDEFVKTVLNE
jgi:hypothetical protein